MRPYEKTILVLGILLVALLASFAPSAHALSEIRIVVVVALFILAVVVVVAGLEE